MEERQLPIRTKPYEIRYGRLEQKDGKLDGRKACQTFNKKGKNLHGMTERNNVVGFNVTMN